MSKLAAIIPAAGLSSRMGDFKPLLPIGQYLCLEKVILTFKNAGDIDIKVVAGHSAHLLTPVLLRHQVDMVINPDYQKGMLSSIQVGLNAFQGDIDAFFVLPVDCPLVQPETIKAMIGHFDNAEGEIIHPCFRGKKGHPPLVTAKLIPKILCSCPDEDNLRSILRNSDFKTIRVDVTDPGILRDMNFKADYERLMRGSL
jgi:molybdenum cofactor cytidylyltransferase